MVWAVSRSKDLSMMVENVEKPRGGGVGIVSLKLQPKPSVTGGFLTSGGRRLEEGGQDEEVYLGIASTLPDLFPLECDAGLRLSRFVLHQTSMCEGPLL
jgi:hypothetical protein